MENAQPALELKDVTKRYPSTTGEAAAAVLENLSLRVEAGESLAVVGPSGSGKSTLLNLMGALDRPSSGCVLLDGEDLGAFSDRRLAGIRNRRIGFVFQLHHLLPQCTVLENVLVPTLAGQGRDDAGDRACELLRRVGLGEFMHRKPGQISGGQRQRVAVVRALINRPKLLLADEPTGSLDRRAADELGDLLVELNREQNVTLIVVTHSASLAGRMHRVLELHDGALSEQRSPQ